MLGVVPSAAPEGLTFKTLYTPRVDEMESTMIACASDPPNNIRFSRTAEPRGPRAHRPNGQVGVVRRANKVVLRKQPAAHLHAVRAYPVGGKLRARYEVDAREHSEGAWRQQWWKKA
eukprot:4658764-Prymnesium_polylepis.2